MGKTIILTSANIEENSNNTKLVSNFRSGGYTFKSDMIALQSVYQYFIIFNITSAYGNNTFSYTWFDGIEYTITIPDGYYEISDLNSYFQSIMFANTHYMTNSAGQFIYFLEFVVNTSRYAVQINSYPLDADIQTTNGYILQVAGLGKDAERGKDDVAPRMKKATEAFKNFDGLQIDTSKGNPKKYISLNIRFCINFFLWI